MTNEKALATKKKAALAAASALLKACVAIQKFRAACRACDEHEIRLDDTRVTLPEKMSEYGNYLNSVFDK